MIKNLHFSFISTLNIQNNLSKFHCDSLIGYKYIEQINILFIYYNILWCMNFT